MGWLPHRLIAQALLLGILLLAASPNSNAASDAPRQTSLAAVALPRYNNAQLLNEVQRRAVAFFWEKSNSNTGLTQDRAHRDGSDRDIEIASIAATGFALAALPVAVRHGWIKRDAAQARALQTLRFVGAMPHQHGFWYHFVNKRSGAREWNSEVSSIDSGILLCGALVCGQFFGGEVQRLSGALYNRADWLWLLHNGGEKPDKLVLSHGWKPESGFLPYDYGYCEAVLLYLLGIGSSTHPIPSQTWAVMGRDVVRYGGLVTLQGGPIFMHQMPHNFFPLQGQRDNLGYDYWVASTNATLINRLYCMDKMEQRRGYGPNFWGLNAGDSPAGYQAFGAPNGPEDGTLSPTGAIASISFTPQLSMMAAQSMYRSYGARIWSRYGFSNAYNLDQNWFDSDVIGIDLGMALLSIENHRSGLLWRLMKRQPLTRRAYHAIGLRPTREKEPRPLNPRLPPLQYPQPKSIQPMSLPNANGATKARRISRSGLLQAAK